MPKWWKIGHLMKRFIGSAKPHGAIFRFLQDITVQKKWFISVFLEIENISQYKGPKLGEKLWKIVSLMERGIGSPKPHRAIFRFFARYYDAEKVIHKRISWNWEDISNSGPKAMTKWWKIEHLMKRFIGSAKPHSSVFHFFARCYDAEEVIHKRISWNWEDISNSGPKSLPKMMKNWTFNEMVHRIHKTSQSRFSLFCKILRCWKRDSSAHFLKSRKYLKRWAQN